MHTLACTTEGVANRSKQGRTIKKRGSRSSCGKSSRVMRTYCRKSSTSEHGRPVTVNNSSYTGTTADTWLRTVAKLLDVNPVAFALAMACLAACRRQTVGVEQSIRVQTTPHSLSTQPALVLPGMASRKSSAEPLWPRPSVPLLLEGGQPVPFIFLSPKRTLLGRPSW